MIAFQKIIIEIKALRRLSSLEESQILNYLRATGFQVSLLINFGAQTLDWKRLVNERNPLAKLA